MGGAARRVRIGSYRLISDPWEPVTPKELILELLGEDRLLLPGLLSRALDANDRVKYLLTLVQTARAAADGEAGVTNLRDERLASGVDDAALDRVVSDSERQSDRRYRIPGVEALTRRAVDEVQQMLAPLQAANVDAAPSLQARAESVTAALNVAGDLVDSLDIARLAAGRAGGEDSLHRVVMDTRKQLNVLQAQIATESIDGARVYGLEPADRGLVRAFIAGIHATERLRFDHPGLGTLATRTPKALVLQNDLGATDARVVVIRITGLVVTITYTDVHLARLLSFQDLLSAWRVEWADTRSRTDTSIEGGLFHLASGRFEAGDAGELERFVEHPGSRLVFIIDWNRARKRLRRLVGRRAAIGLLGWAAEHGYGQMAFLRAGADGLVYEALEFAGGRAVHAGESLQDALGTDAAEAYLRAVMRICAEGLLADKPISLVPGRGSG
jgi:hypothetical protein